MVGNLLSVKTHARGSGFQLRLRDPASLGHQQSVIPVTHRVAGYEVPQAIHSETGYSFEVFQYGPLIADTVRFAHKHGVGGDIIQKMMTGPKNELFGNFERLGFAVCEFLAQRGAKAQVKSRDCMRSILQHAGNDELLEEFDAVFERLVAYLNFNIGLVRDFQSASFGQSSATYKFRVFSSPDPLVLQFGFDEADIHAAAQASAVFHQLLPVGMVESFTWRNGFRCEFSDVDFKFEIPSKTPSVWLDATIERATEIQAELDDHFTAPDCSLDELELLDAELAGMVLRIAGGEVGVLLQDVEALMESQGWAFGESLVSLLSLLKYIRFKKEFSQCRAECKVDELVPPHSDSTYFSFWLSAAKVHIQDVVDLASKRKAVFSCVGESDIDLDATVIVDPISIQNTSFLLDEYQSNYESLMDGVVDTASSCIFLNDDTIDAIEGWQQAIAVIAAISAASNVRKE